MTVDALLDACRRVRPTYVSGPRCGKICEVNLADRIEAGFDRAVARARKRSGVFDHVWQALERFVDVLGGRLAAAISYYAFFAAFSLAVLAYSILGRLLGSAEAGVLSAVNDYLETQLPWVAETAEQVGRGEITLMAGVALLVSGVGWVETLRSSLRAVWLLDQHPGHWFLRRVVDLGMLVGLGLLLGLSLAMTWAIDWLLDWLAADTGVGPGGAGPDRTGAGVHGQPDLGGGDAHCGDPGTAQPTAADHADAGDRDRDSAAQHDRAER